MKFFLRLLFLLFVFAGAVALGCGDVPIDNTRADQRLFPPPSGVIRGTFLYQGPHPCSSQGHIVGNAIVLFFAKENPPPPAGLATTAVNFGSVSGDLLFANEPRSMGSDVYCPKDYGATDTISAAAPFVVSPFVAGSYIALAFFDTTGDFLPTFQFRNLPERGDIGGGHIDTTDAQKHIGDANYQPKFLPIDVGVPTATRDGVVLSMPSQGYVADNVVVVVGSPFGLTRPYFYPDGSQEPAKSAVATAANPSADPNFVPVVTMPQDLQIDAPPASLFNLAAVNTFQSKFPAVRLVAGVPAAEVPVAVSGSGPFHFQVGPSAPQGTLFVWNSGKLIPEGNGVPSLYPLAVFSKLIDDFSHAKDPQSIVAQAGAGRGGSRPIVVILGIPLAPTSDTIVGSVLSPPGPAPSLATAADHVTVLVRPSVLCIDPNHPSAGATLVTPHLNGPSADPSEAVPPEGKPIFDQAGVKAALAPLFGAVTIKQGCLPPGRYSMNLVYPDGQAWTVPNETGSCALAEGAVDFTQTPAACSGKPRPVLYSQGTRAVLEVTPASAPSAICSQFPVPLECGGP